MKITNDRCPYCGLPPKGTLEMVPGLALLQPKDDAPGLFEYSGETKMFWDEQKTIDRNGQAVLVCESGHEWQSPIDWSDDVKPAGITLVDPL